MNPFPDHLHKNVNVTTIMFLMSGDLTGLCLYIQWLAHWLGGLGTMAQTPRDKGEGGQKISKIA